MITRRKNTKTPPARPGRWPLLLLAALSLLAPPALGQAPLEEDSEEEGGIRLDESYIVGSLDENAPPLLLPQTPRLPKNPDAALLLPLGTTTLAVVIGAELVGIGRNISAPPLAREGLGTTLQKTGAAFALSGLSLFPSAGHAYASAWKRAALGVGIRAGALLLGSGLLAQGASRPQDDLLDAAAFGAAGLLGAAALVSAVIDVIDGEKAVRRANLESTP